MRKLKIVSAIHLGCKKGYNLRVKGEDHNFTLANGVISGNSHSACYGFIAYQTAWLKHYYPSEFMCACLISDSDESEKIIRYIAYCREAKIQVLPPDINYSQVQFSLDKDAIRFGLGAIKNLGDSPVQTIIEEREARGQFKNILDFASRVNLSIINRKKLESLVLAGAFESTDSDGRASLLATIDSVIQYREECKKYESKLESYQRKQVAYLQREQEIQQGCKKKSFKLPQQPLLPTAPTILASDPLAPLEQLNYERELLGFYISGHPLTFVQHLPAQAITILQATQLPTESKCILAGVPVLIKETTTRKKEKMCHVTIEDESGTIGLVIFPATYKKVANSIGLGRPALWSVIINRQSTDEENFGITRARVSKVSIMALKDSVVAGKRFLHLLLSSQVAPSLFSLLVSDPSATPVSLVIEIKNDFKSCITLTTSIKANLELLKQKCQKANIIIR